MDANHSGFGYVISVTSNGFMVWSKLAGGALVFVPNSALRSTDQCSIQSGNQEFNLPPVAVTGKKISDYPLPSVVCYEAVSMNSIDQHVADIYYPVFSASGTITTVLGQEHGAILTTVWSNQAVQTNKNRPVPQTNDKIFCPPWAFMDAIDCRRWREHCRTGTQYRTRCVFVREKDMAYGCYWMALAIKQDNPVAFYGPTSFLHSEEASKRVALFDEYKQLMAKRTDWNAEEAMQRFNATMFRLENDNTAHTASDYTANCAALKRLLENPTIRANIEQQSRPQQIAVPSNISTGGARKKRTCSETEVQTVVDNQFYNEAKFFLIDAAAGCRPEHADEFWSRFMWMESMMK